MNDAEAWRFARKHVDVWNSHDLDAIVELYSELAELSSPLTRSLGGASSVSGRAALRAYFEQGLRKYPELRFELVDVFLCGSSVALLFRGAGGRLVNEVMLVGESGKIERVAAHYRCAPPE